ncbi:MAG: DUF4912 domain-containing protein [Planctomycetota bacterium]|nr:DUF4912 domain-containing protein [Planctomycetota bacterium]
MTGRPPASFEEEFFALLPVDPHRVHACWEIRETTISSQREVLGDLLSSLVMRYSAEPTTRWEDGGSTRSRDLVLESSSGKVYLDLEEGGLRIRGQIGLLSRAGEFLPLVEARTVELPRSGESPVFEDQRLEIVASREDGERDVGREAAAAVADPSERLLEARTVAGSAPPPAGGARSADAIPGVFPGEAAPLLEASPVTAPEDLGEPLTDDRRIPDDVYEVLRPSILPSGLAAGIVPGEARRRTEPPTGPSEVEGSFASGERRDFAVADAALATDEESEVEDPRSGRSTRPLPRPAFASGSGFRSLSFSSWTFSPVGRHSPGSPTVEDS